MRFRASAACSLMMTTRMEMVGSRVAGCPQALQGVGVGVVGTRGVPWLGQQVAETRCLVCV